MNIKNARLTKYHGKFNSFFYLRLAFIVVFAVILFGGLLKNLIF